jgi:hypothetical protein
LNQKQEEKSRAAVWIVIAMVAASFAAVMPAATAANPAIAGLTVSPSFINLGQNSTITLEIASSMGVNQDDYMVTVFEPGGTILASQWFNFTTVGPMSMLLGNATVGFAAMVSVPGVYRIDASWWNSTSAAFEPGAQVFLEATDVLFVTTEFAAGSDAYTDLHTCQLAEEFQRGDGIIARGYIRYASSGEILNGTLVPSAKGNVTGTLMGTTKTLNYNAQYFWRAAWQLPWDAPLGTFQYEVNASDGMGNHGYAISPPAGRYGALKVIPAILDTKAWTANATSGNVTSAFYPGETVQVVVSSAYDAHKNHNYAFTNTNAADKNESYRLGPERSGVATAVVGTGAFDSVNKTFANQLASLPMTFDAPSGTWRATWAVPAAGPLAGNITVKAFTTDGAPTPNAGSATTTFSTLPLPEPVTTTVIQNRTVYQNQTVEVAAPGTISAVVGYGLAGAAVAIGAIVGYVLAQRRRGGGGAASAPSSPSEGKKQEPAGEKKKGEEGWD